MNNSQKYASCYHDFLGIFTYHFTKMLVLYKFMVKVIVFDIFQIVFEVFK